MDERVEDYVMRIRKGARQLNMEPAAICDVIINGLRPAIRMHVLLQRGAGVAPQLEELVKYARLAEAVVVTPTDNSANLLLEVMKATAASNGQQAEQLKKLTDRVAALAVIHEENQVNAIQPGSQRRNGPPSQRTYKATPQRQQRDNWARNAEVRTAEGGAKNFRQQNNEQSDGAQCGR